MHLGDRLRKARRAANMTQQDLAKRLRVSPMQISHWERGQEPRLRYQRRLARALGKTLDELFG